MRGMRGSDIAMIFQEPMTALNPLYTVGDQIAETIVVHDGVTANEARKRAVALLGRTGIAEPGKRVNSYPHQLSGGQRQRAMIAMALACRPRLLLADEPTTALDVTIRAQIVELLLELQRDEAEKRGMAVLLITHDLNLVRHFAQRIAVMEQGVLVESGPVEQVFESPQHPYTQRLLASRPQRTVVPVLPISPVLLEAREISVDFKTKLPGFSGWFRSGRFRAVADANVSVRQGETLGIVGESGSGKSTLAMALLGLQRTAHGEIEFQGRALGSYRGAEQTALRSNMQVVFQDPFSSLSPRQTIERIVGEGLALHRPQMTPQARRDKVIVGAARSRPRPHGAVSLSARIFRRPASADRDCARAGARTAHPDPRRTDQRARRVHSAAGAETARRVATEVQPRLRFHQPRSGGNRGDGASCRGHAKRFDRRKRRG